MPKAKEGSKRFHLNKADLYNTGKVFLWVFISAGVVALVDYSQTSEFPPELLWSVPVLNVLAVIIKKVLNKEDGKIFN